MNARVEKEEVINSTQRNKYPFFTEMFESIEDEKVKQAIMNLIRSVSTIKTEIK